MFVSLYARICMGVAVCECELSVFNMPGLAGYGALVFLFCLYLPQMLYLFLIRKFCSNSLANACNLNETNNCHLSL